MNVILNYLDFLWLLFYHESDTIEVAWVKQGIYFSRSNGMNREMNIVLVLGPDSNQKKFHRIRNMLQISLFIRFLILCDNLTKVLFPSLVSAHFHRLLLLIVSF